MKSSYSFSHIVLFVTATSLLTARSTYAQDSINTKHSIKERLTVPFGKIVSMNIEIVDGDKLGDKVHQSSFLIKVNSVENLPLSKPFIFEFKHETGHFPSDEFELYKHLYGKKTGEISSKTSKEIKKHYVGKEFTIMGYESGEFTGIPDNYFKYQPVRQDRGFFFNNYIIIVADLTKSN